MNAADFDYKRIAQGYKERPFLHGQVIERFRRDVTEELFLNGLDVGCGAGLSSKALKRICGHVTGTDISQEMIAVAKEVCKDLPEFPKPFRDESVWTADDVERYQFSMIDQVRYEMEYQFDMKSFIQFMMIQSNVNARIEGEGRNIADVLRWFEQSLEVVFNKEQKTAIFAGYGWYIRMM